LAPTTTTFPLAASCCAFFIAGDPVPIFDQARSMCSMIPSASNLAGSGAPSFLAIECRKPEQFAALSNGGRCLYA
jgi:hypothetical protein